MSEMSEMSEFTGEAIAVAQAPEKKTRRVRKPWVDGPIGLYKVGGANPNEHEPLTRATFEDFASPDEARAWVSAQGEPGCAYECHVRVFRVRAKAQTAVVLEEESL